MRLTQTTRGRHALPEESSRRWYPADGTALGLWGVLAVIRRFMSMSMSISMSMNARVYILNARCIPRAFRTKQLSIRQVPVHSKDAPNVHSTRIRPVCIQERGPCNVKPPTCTLAPAARVCMAMAPHYRAGEPYLEAKLAVVIQNGARLTGRSHRSHDPGSTPKS